jgi:hypothetical protein
VKARLQSLISTGLSIVKPGPARSPEAVGPAAAVGDGTTAPMTGSGQHEKEPLPTVPEPAKGEAGQDPYVGDDRRKKNRRRGALPTTLDTRKDGMERRKQGRISLKV